MIGGQLASPRSLFSNVSVQNFEIAVLFKIDKITKTQGSTQLPEPGAYVVGCAPWADKVFIVRDGRINREVAHLIGNLNFYYAC